ncbi:protein NRT1/ PTR FAMILY 5.4 [Quercus suber]|uniref:protein NRT1/ PTR FAMILY 5.4 n=1 Tax=Quercus suber TaxID=58331 RepID=UPI0032E049BD
MSNFSYQPSSMDSSVAPVMIEDGQKETRLVSTKQKSSRGGWNAAIFVIFVEMAERFAYYGLAGNLITYLTNELHEPLTTAAKNVNTWIGVSTLFPILGAFIADSYLGRFNTIIISSVIFLLGTVLLTLSVSVFPLHLRKAMSFLALYILSVGEGGHKPCVQTFAADQFDEVTPEEKKAKSSFFNWWYLGIVAAATSASLVVIYVQDNIGWTEGFGIPIGVIAVALTIFLLGIKKYRKEDPVGSPFTGVAQVFVAAARKWRMDETHHGRGVYYGVPSEGQPNTWIFARTDQFRYTKLSTPFLWCMCVYCVHIKNHVPGL